jgi:ssDNA-binding Zn-finger/Zn-ribbon topoisomerase 1
MKKQMQHCFNCGKELGVYESYYGDFETCGERECEREARNAQQEQDDMAQDAARQNNYERYRR